MQTKNFNLLMTLGIFSLVLTACAPGLYNVSRSHWHKASDLERQHIVNRYYQIKEDGDIEQVSDITPYLREQDCYPPSGVGFMYAKKTFVHLPFRGHATNPSEQYHLRNTQKQIAKAQRELS